MRLLMEVPIDNVLKATKISAQTNNAKIASETVY
jgi:hypothetical protein